ncbi:MAG: type I-E CRISPR-associated protein Cse1/CasA [Candidatus Brocadiaceae bacterium]|nr:type I-E CRISPR-associated protein Cse1/CasA [Candidatus Brocadiaceae bacterium]
MLNKFNLVDEPWIPVAGRGLVSLATVFSDKSLSALGGNPVQKIALTKLLLAIAQSAYTPGDDDDWNSLGASGMAKKTLDYLMAKRDLFWLYGERPFLQMPMITDIISNRKKNELKNTKTAGKAKEAEERALPKFIGSAEYPDLPSENNTVLTQNHGHIVLTDAEKAVFLVTVMNFALGGKRVEKDIPPLTTGYVGKSPSAKSGPSIGNHWGYLHSFLTGTKILDTVWINLLTHEQIKEYRIWLYKCGEAPWEKMPMGEDDQTAVDLKNSYMGCLVGLCRFVLLIDDGIFYVEGIQYPSHKTGWREPTMAISETNKLLWVNPAKRPWRELTALLSFIENQSIGGFDCQQIRWTLGRAKSLNKFNVWSGGLRVRGNAGDQSVKQDDDFVESEIQLDASVLGEIWFSNLKHEMDDLDKLSKITYSATLAFFKAQKADGKDQAAQAGNLFWQLCERRFQELVNACGDNSGEEVKKLRRTFAGFVDKAYNTYCLKGTARQIDAWASNLPSLSKYLN